VTRAVPFQGVRLGRLHLAALAAVVLLGACASAADPYAPTATKTTAAGGVAATGSNPQGSLPVSAAATCEPVRATPAPGLTPEPEGRLCPPIDVPTPPIRPAPLPSGQDERLQALLDDVLAPASQAYGVYVKNLADGSSAGVNFDRVYRAASLFKLYVMWEAFRQASLGSLSFEEVLEVAPYYAAFELGTNAVEAGDLVTVAETLRLMMSVSDTPTAVLLQDRVGVANINQALRALGIENSGLPYPADTAATARDVGVLLEAIFEDEGVSETARAEMIALLLSAEIDHGLRAGVPATVDVAHKTGSLAMVLHDAGVVFSPGATYVLVILWDRQGGPSLIEAVSRSVYAYFNPGD